MSHPPETSAAAAAWLTRRTIRRFGAVGRIAYYRYVVEIARQNQTMSDFREAEENGTRLCRSDGVRGTAVWARHDDEGRLAVGTSRGVLWCVGAASLDAAPRFRVTQSRCDAAL